MPTDNVFQVLLFDPAMQLAKPLVKELESSGYQVQPYRYLGGQGRVTCYQIIGCHRDCLAGGKLFTVAINSRMGLTALAKVPAHFGTGVRTTCQRGALAIL